MKTSENFVDRNGISVAAMRAIVLPLIIILLLLIAVSLAMAMPPHRDVEEKIIQGEIPHPDFMKQSFQEDNPGLNSGSGPFYRKPGLTAKTTVPSDFKILTILVDFSDNTGSTNPVDFDTLIYADINGTVHNYYKEISYGTILINSPIWPSAVGWVRAPSQYSVYVGGNYGMGSYPFNSQKLVEEIVDAVDASVDFSQFDNDGDTFVDGLIIAHAGSGAEFTGSFSDIWSHKWYISPRLVDGVYVSDYTINPEFWAIPGDITIGVYCHELGHIYGLPDLYDTDYSSYGIDEWSLMARGCWNGPSYMGSYPAHPDAWSRIFLDIVFPVIPSHDQTNVSIPQVKSSPVIFKLWTGGLPGNEYFLVENRQKKGYDTFLPGDGLLIWHIDESKPDNTDEWWPLSGNPSHYKVALEQADHLWELEHKTGRADSEDPFPGRTANRNFSALTSPNSDSYSGTGTSVSVVNISNSGATMTADITVGTPQGISAYDDLLPGKLRILGNNPNPFNPTTAIKFEVLQVSRIKLEIFNITGQRIKLLTDGEFEPGIYSIPWNGRDNNEDEIGSGVYFYRISVDGRSVSRKMLKLS
jgi:immune inhibitor A